MADMFLNKQFRMVTEKLWTLKEPLTLQFSEPVNPGVLNELRRAQKAERIKEANEESISFAVGQEVLILESLRNEVTDTYIALIGRWVVWIPYDPQTLQCSITILGKRD